MSPYLNDCLTREVLCFTGKGGVGKSTLAWATALACHRLGKKVRVVGWNPLDRHPRYPGIEWLSLNVSDCFREYVTRVLKFETLYNVIFDNHVLQAFLRATPGLADTVLAGKIWDLWSNREQDLLIVDLPASGHATSFFQSALGVSKVFAKGFVHEESSKVLKLFSSAATRVDLVALPQELPVKELLELHAKLKGILPLNFGYVHLNQVEPQLEVPASLPTSLSSEIRECVRGHAARGGDERESADALSVLGLPLHRIPRLPAENLKQNQLAVAAYLEEGR